jgi:TPR repeat protein
MAAETIFKLGMYYYNGEDGIPKNVAKAVELFHQSADMGHAEAAFNLAVLYIAGEDVPKDNIKAVEYFQKVLEMCYKNNELVEKLMDKEKELRDMKAKNKELVEELQGIKTASQVLTLN